jgi:hypothetical protein
LVAVGAGGSVTLGSADGVTEGERVEVGEGTAVAGRRVLVETRVGVGVASGSVALLVGAGVVRSPAQAVTISRRMMRQRNGVRRRRVEALIKIRVTSQARF